MYEEDVKKAEGVTALYNSDTYDSYKSKDFNNNIIKVKVVGVGGGGGNAVNRMIEAGITSAEFVAVNTDKQALYMSDATKKIQIGEQQTKGLGAGADPNVGAKAAEESKQELKDMLEGVDLLFITAGMGGGTGTGAAPVIASLSREMGILTVAVVTKPFGFEGAVRMSNAMQGIDRLREYVDALLIIPNDKLLKVLPKGTPIVKAFKEADEILRKGIQGISDLIVTPSMINLDFADVKSIIHNAGYAHLGVGEGTGEDRAITAVQQAVSSPLLDSNILGSSGVIINITGGMDLSMDEVENISDLIHEVVDPTANIILGAGVDEKMQDRISVTLVATGFKGREGNEPNNNDNDMRDKIEDFCRKHQTANPKDEAQTNVLGAYNKPQQDPHYNNGYNNNGYGRYNEQQNHAPQGGQYRPDYRGQANEQPVRREQNNAPDEPSFIRKMRERNNNHNY